MSNTAFSVLKTNSLKMADHSTVDTTALDRMGLFINQTIQQIIARPEGRRFAQDYGSVNTVSDQEYVELSNLTGTLNSGFSVDEISSAYQTTDDIWLERWSIQQYRQVFPDVSTNSGNPEAFARWGDRLYLYPRPSSVIALSVDFWVIPAALSADGDLSIINPKYDDWILTGAVLRWKRTFEEDEGEVKKWERRWAEVTAIFGKDLRREPSRRPVARSHSRRSVGRFPWVTPAGQ